MGNALVATVCAVWPGTENGDAATSNDEKTFEFIFFPHFAGVNYVHLYVCTLNFRRNKICTYPRVAFLSFFLSLSIPFCAIATEMQSTNNSNRCTVSSYCEVIEITVWACVAHNFNPILCARISLCGLNQSKSEYCIYSLRWKGKPFESRDHYAKLSYRGKWPKCVPQIGEAENGL